MREEHAGEVSRWAGRMSAAQQLVALRAFRSVNKQMVHRCFIALRIACEQQRVLATAAATSDVASVEGAGASVEEEEAMSAARAAAADQRAADEQAAAEAMSAARAAAMSEEAQAHARKREAATAAELERQLAAARADERSCADEQWAAKLSAAQQVVVMRAFRSGNFSLLRRCFVALRLNARRDHDVREGAMEVARAKATAALLQRDLTTAIEARHAAEADAAELRRQLRATRVVGAMPEAAAAMADGSAARQVAQRLCASLASRQARRSRLRVALCGLRISAAAARMARESEARAVRTMRGVGAASEIFAAARREATEVIEAAHAAAELAAQERAAAAEAESAQLKTEVAALRDELQRARACPPSEPPLPRRPPPPHASAPSSTAAASIAPPMARPVSAACPRGTLVHTGAPAAAASTPGRPVSPAPSDASAASAVSLAGSLRETSSRLLREGGARVAGPSLADSLYGAAWRLPRRAQGRKVNPQYLRIWEQAQGGGVGPGQLEQRKCRTSTQ